MKAVIFDLGGTLTHAQDDAVRLHAHVDELLPILYRLGIKVGVVASHEQEYIDHINQHPIRKYVHTVITPQHVSQPKPHPEGVLLALRHLEVHPSQAVFVGDTVFDIRAGRDAGVAKVIGVMHGLGNPVALHAAGADHLISDIPSLLDVLE